MGNGGRGSYHFLSSLEEVDGGADWCTVGILGLLPPSEEAGDEVEDHHLEEDRPQELPSGTLLLLLRSVPCPLGSFLAFCLNYFTFC